MCSMARSRLSRFSELAVGKKKRVAAGKEHVADFGVLFEVIDGAVEIEFAVPVRPRR